MNNKTKQASQKARTYETPMSRVREIIPIISQQSSDPSGSYTGTFADEFDKKPVQDADDL